MIAAIISLTIPPPMLTPSSGNNHDPMNAPIMPMMMSPTIPKPAPLTIRPASQPAIKPTIKMMTRLSVATLMGIFKSVGEAAFRVTHAIARLDAFPRVKRQK